MHSPGPSTDDALTDEQLLADIRQGSRGAFAMLVRRHSVRFYRLAYRFTADAGAAEDIVQDAFLKLWEQPDLFQPAKGARFTTWFYRVLVNASLNWQKKRRFAPLPEEDLLPDTGPNAEQMLALHRDQHMLESAIAALPERQRAALNLCFYEGLKNAEAADVLKIRVGALESLLMRAKATLRETLKKKGVLHEPAR